MPLRFKTSITKLLFFLQTAEPPLQIPSDRTKSNDIGKNNVFLYVHSKIAMPPTRRQIWSMTYPILISLMMENMIGLTDTAFLGRVGEVELGASAIAGVYYMAIFMIGFGFSIGTQILIGRRNGEQNYLEIGPILQQGVLFLILLATVMCIASHAFTPTILRKMISSTPVYEAAVAYTNWRVYGFFFSFIAIMFRAFYVGITHTKILTANSLVMLSVNIVLNYALIFGKWGFPALGIAGAAIASTVSELASALFFLIYTRTKIDHRKYTLFQFHRFRPGLLKQMLDVSIWTMFQAFISVSVWFLFFAAIEHLGERELAISNIIRNTSGFIFMIVSAFASTTNALVSNQMGAGKSNLVIPTSIKTIKLCYAIIIPAALLFAAAPHILLRIYTDNVSLVESSIPSLWVMLSSYLLTVPAVILFNTVSGTGNTKHALLLEMLTLALYTVYTFVIVFHFKADVAVCWTTEHIYALVLLILVTIYLKKANWRQKSI